MKRALVLSVFSLVLGAQAFADSSPSNYFDTIEQVVNAGSSKPSKGSSNGIEQYREAINYAFTTQGWGETVYCVDLAIKNGQVIESPNKGNPIAQNLLTLMSEYYRNAQSYSVAGGNGPAVTFSYENGNTVRTTGINTAADSSTIYTIVFTKSEKVLINKGTLKNPQMVPGLAPRGVLVCSKTLEYAQSQNSTRP